MGHLYVSGVQFGVACIWKWLEYMLKYDNHSKLNNQH